MDVAENIQLLRRTGPYQLALLSHLRRDDQILPVMKGVWDYSLHVSCPGSGRGDAFRYAHCSFMTPKSQPC